MKQATKPFYPSTVLTDALREKGFTCRCAWECRVSGSRSDWITCYLVAGEGRVSPVIVQTFWGDLGWEAWVPAHAGNDIARTVEAVVASVTQ